MSDPYETLGVAKDASREDIRKAYRRKAKKAHPDRGGSAAEFNAIAVAHRVLSDEGRRKTFDDTGRIDDAPDAADARALEIISALLEGHLGAEAKFTPALKVMQQALAEQQRMISGEREKAARAAVRFEDLRGRFKTKRATDPIGAMLAAKAQREHSRVAMMDAALGDFARADIILAEYEFTQAKGSPPLRDEPVFTFFHRE